MAERKDIEFEEGAKVDKADLKQVNGGASGKDAESGAVPGGGAEDWFVIIPTTNEAPGSDK